MNQRRKRRYPKSRDKYAGSVLWIGLTVVLLAIAVAFSPFGTKWKDSLCTPILDRFENDMGEEVMDTLAQQEGTLLPSASPEIALQSSTTTLQAEPYYLLQMGVYKNEAEAQEFALQIRAMGGAGYIHSDQANYRVFASAYCDAESISIVQDQLRKDGFSSSAFPTDRASVRVTLQGREDAISKGEQALHTVGELPQALSDFVLKYDMDGLTAQEGVAYIAEKAGEMNEILEALSSCEDDGIQKICAMLEQYLNALSTFSKGYANMSDEDVSSGLKHLQIEIIFLYLSFIQE